MSVSIRWLSVKESACNAGDVGLIPGSERSPGIGNGNPLQYPCLENSMNRGAWWATVHRVAESDMTAQCTNTSAYLKLKEKLKETGNIYHNIIYFGWPSCWQRSGLQNRLHFKRSYNFLGKKKRIFLPSSLVFYLLYKALNLHIQTLEGSRCFWGG